jgi:hypothetical protein
MSALLTEDTFEDTEIIFTAVPVLDTQLPDSQSLEQAEPLPDHVEFLKNKLREQQLRKKRIAARDSDDITSTNSTRNSRAQLWKKMMARTESLNADAEKFNTQSAVLLSALQKLQASIETSQREKETLANSFKGLNADCENLKEELRGGLAILQNETSAAASNNETSAGLIQRIEMLLEETQGNHANSKAQAAETLSILEKAQQHEALFSESADSFAHLRGEAEGFVGEARKLSEEAREQSDSLQELINRNQAITDRLQTLSDSMVETRAEMLEERVTQKALNEQIGSRIKQTEKLNQQQTTLIELTESRSEELKVELENAVQQNRKYQLRLQQTEEKLKEAISLQENYKADYERSQELLQKNEAVLTRAATDLKETDSYGAQFTSSLAKFHQANEQAQHMAMRTQSTLDKIIARNEYLEKENRALSERLTGSMGFHSPAMAMKPSTLAKNTRASLQQPDEFLMDDSPAFGELNLEAKSGFYRLMMVLAIILPLSYIAHSVISTFASPIGTAQELQSQQQFNSSPPPLFPSAFAPVASNNP